VAPANEQADACQTVVGFLGDGGEAVVVRRSDAAPAESKKRLQP
jgi:hypothetical protein